VSKPAVVPPKVTGDWRERLRDGLVEAGLVSSADAVERSEITASANELSIVVAGRVEQLALDDAQAKKLMEQVAGKRVTVKIGKPAVSAPLLEPASAPKTAPVVADPAAQRALEHPEVQRFRELFPEGHVRQVRDLKE
jgi:hypothetical protein